MLASHPDCSASLGTCGRPEAAWCGWCFLGRLAGDLHCLSPVSQELYVFFVVFFFFLPDAHRPPPRRQRKRRRQLPPRLQSCHRVKLPCLRSGICVPLSVTHTPSIPTSLQNREHQLFPIGPVHFSTGRGDGGGKVERGRGNEQRRGRNKGRKKLTMLLSSPVCLASVTC